MKVHIQNYKDGQLIQHSSILFLKAFISFETGDSNSKVFNLSKDLEIIQQDTINLTPTSCQFKSFNTSFISLIKLSNGLNTIHFKDKTAADKTPTGQEFKLNYCPLKGNYSIVPFYIFSQDAQDSINLITNSINNKLELGLQVIQGFFGEKLFEHGFVKRAFQIQPDIPRFISIQLKSDAILEMESSSLWEYLAMVIRGRDDLWSRQYKYVAFMAHPWKSQVEGHGKLALGGGGLVLMGSDFLKVWPEDVSQVLDTIFNSEALHDPQLVEAAFRFGDVGRTVGSLYAASLGSLAHEMGHIFDLGHSELGLMGSQFYRMESSLSPVISYPPVLKGMIFLPPKVGLISNAETAEDVVSIGHSCAAILYHHRWFVPGLIDEADAKNEGPELIKEKIISKIPLSAIQIRNVEDSKVLKDWTFTTQDQKTSNCHEFTLAKNYIPMSCKSGDALVIAQDSQGNILKKTINRDLLPQSFTVIQRR